MALYNFILLVTLYLLKPVRDSLFLVELGPQQLPIVFICTAIVAIPVSIGYSRLSNRAALGWVINGVTFFLSLTLVLIWWLLRIDSAILYYVLYIWVSIYSILITSQFWLLANALFNATQAKRIFSLLSLSAIAGAIAGGEITGLLISRFAIASETLLLIGAAILFSTIFLIQAIRVEANKFLDQEPATPEPVTDDQSYMELLFKDVLTSRHLFYIIGIIALSVITTTIIDYQFKTVASRVYTAENSLTSFMGHFYGRVSLIALLLQFFLSSKFIERKGVGGAVVILPSILLLGSVGLFIWPGLITAVLLRGADQSLKHSLDRTGRELLFIPVELDLKKRTKVFIDLFVDNGAQGIAGLLLLLLTFVLSLTVQQISLIVIGLLVCWITLAVLVRRSYVDEFRESIEDQLNGDAAKHEAKDTTLSLDNLIKNLESSEAIEVRNSLKKLDKNYRQQHIPAETIEELLHHPDELVRKRTLRLLRHWEMNGYMENVASLLEDSDPEVRLEAARYIYHFYDPEKYKGNRLEILKEGLHHQDVKIRAAALGLIAKDGGEQERALLTTELLAKTLTYEGEDDEELKYETARVLGVAYNASRDHILQALLQDSSELVVKQAIISAGQSGERTFIHILLEFLDSQTYKKTAQKALSLYGERIFGTLFDYLMDNEIRLSKRLPIPSVLYLNSSQVALDVLQIALDESIIPVRHEIIRSLNKMKQQLVAPNFNKEKLKKAVHVEIRRHVLFKQSYKLMETRNENGELSEIVEKEIAKSFENIFRLLGLVYNAEDIYNAYKGIKSDNLSLISEGIEFLENLIEWDIKRDLLPLLESLLMHQNNYGKFEGFIISAAEAFDYLAKIGHPQIQALAKDKKFLSS